ncbi:histone deacetylase family protein [Paucibacter sp. DJ2R-2]|uniref:histone deacetylase family protein n=1 Tax=Paucibacter sp. DJ2R-2 TaxID=2893558 RepID=UPI0021E3FD09|nr:histone deacetylase family protein [Paucibacter sp. DJ2R-2]MCV2423233.1 histone deacetylase family protein [Paucibacter sp. DJ4R-1]MCV2440689.1 histone deacetylase family protein [Paucibacter sp. DJ2R-2]
MKTVYNARHAAHAATHEFFRGRLVPAFEVPARADYVLAAVQAAQLGALLEPVDHGLAPLERVHAPAYLRFVQGAWAEWQALGGEGDAFPAVWPVRSLRSDVVPPSFAARMGLYSMDSGTPLTSGSWEAAYWGAQASLTGLDQVLAGERSAYVLTRPPGHHAGADFFGGYCFVNNAAVAAQAALDAGLQRVAILDVDYHHGNGTQAIFYDRADVFYASLHGDPQTEFPFFLGHADETGAGAGQGFNANFPLPAGASNEAWFTALEAALERLQAYAPELLIVSLGVDTYGGDPISHFKLDRPEFSRLGQRLAAFGARTLFLQEGGYATEAIGHNVVAVLQGFEPRP